MRKFLKRIGKSASQIPGALVYVGDKVNTKTKITVIDYNETNFSEKEVERIEDCFCFKNTATTTWINIDGLKDLALIEKLGSSFDLHAMTLEDIVNTSQRPKYEGFDEYFLLVFKMLCYQPQTNESTIEQVSIVASNNYVISFQETEGDVFNLIRDRLRAGKGRVRRLKSDYLVYSLLDAVVDGYFVVLEKMGDRIEKIEESIVNDPSPLILEEIHALKQELIYLRKAFWPLREVILRLEREEPEIINKSTEVFLRDLYDHVLQVIDTVETFRDTLASMLDVYLSSLSHKMNEVMKVLTMIATIFIPITFIVGLYGMNFNTHNSPWNMPELNWRYGYPFALGLMIFVVVFMLSYFKRKKWI